MATPTAATHPPKPEHPARLAVLLASQLRALDRALPRLDDLFVPAHQFDSFVSTDNRSLFCLQALMTQRPDSIFVRSVRWHQATPTPERALEDLIGPLDRGPWGHLVQWMRLQHAWRGMERHEANRGASYTVVVKMRTDVLLPTPLLLGPLRQSMWQKPLLFMRGDWFFWGSRAVVERAVEFADALPRYMRLGDAAYLPIPWRRLLSFGPEGLSSHASFWSWLWYPRHTQARPWAFAPHTLGNASAFLAHVRAHLDALESYELGDERLGWPPSEHLNASRAAPDRMVTNKPGSFSAAYPENEKCFVHHLWTRGVAPRSACIDPSSNQTWAILRQDSTTGRQLSRILLWERKRKWCDCACNFTEHMIVRPRLVRERQRSHTPHLFSRV